MDHYQEITLIPQMELSTYIIWTKLYQKLHLSLVNIHANNIGISFPEYERLSENLYNCRLGNKLRIFSSTEDLQKLALSESFKYLKDYVHISSIRSVPANIKEYGIYQRQQFKSSPERLARRSVKTGMATDFDSALKKYCKTVKMGTLPFIQLLSSSTGDHHFKLFIAKTVTKERVYGSFNSYGLSIGGCVPEF